MENFNWVFSTVVGVFIVPVVQWLKTKIPADLPITTTMMSAAIALVAAFAIAKTFFPELSTADVVGQFKTMFMAGTIGHAALKTVKKNTLIGADK